MHDITRYFLLFYGLFETFVFSGNVLGWTALHSLLIKEGVYSDACPKIEQKNATDRTETFIKIEDAPCAEQEHILNLVFTIGGFCLGATSIVWGFLLDKCGLRIVRLLLNAMITSGTILLSLTNKSRPHLIFPSLILMCLAGIPLRLANLQIADLFPKYRSTIITLYSGGFVASSAVFVFIKFGMDSGLSWEWSCSILVIFSLLMLPVTLFVLPSTSINSNEGLFNATHAGMEIPGTVPACWGTYKTLSEFRDLNVTLIHNMMEKKNENCFKKEENVGNIVFTEKPRDSPLSLWNSVSSFSYLMHQYWFSWLLLYTIFFVGTLHLWAESSYSTQGIFFAEIYCLLQIAGLFLSPLCGIFMDWSLKRADEALDPQERRLNITQSNFWPLAVTSLTAVVAQISQFFFSNIAIWVSIVFVTICRILLMSIGTAYLRVRFPGNHFNRLVGIMSTVSSVFTVLQFGLFLWARRNSTVSLLQVSIFNTVCLLLACIHPLLICVTPLQKYLLKRQEAVLSAAHPENDLPKTNSAQKILAKTKLDDEGTESEKQKY